MHLCYNLCVCVCVCVCALFFFVSLFHVRTSLRKQEQAINEMLSNVCNPIFKAFVERILHLAKWEIQMEYQNPGNEGFFGLTFFFGFYVCLRLDTRDTK